MVAINLRAEVAQSFVDQVSSVAANLGGYVILNSYHCSRLNTNTGRLTPAMFEDVFRRARALIDG